MLTLLRFATRGAGVTAKGAAFLSSSSSPSFLAHASSTRRRVLEDRPHHSTRSDAGGSGGGIRRPMDAPYFPVYYNDVYEVDMAPGHRFPMGKYRKVREALQTRVGSLSKEEQMRVHCEFRVSPLATREQLVTTHDADYVQRYLSGNTTKLENRNIGFPWSHQHVNNSLSSVGGTVAAACAAWEEYLRRHEHLRESSTQRKARDVNMQPQHSNEETAHPCWAAHVAGGTHHAFRDYGEGFCIFSDIAVAANVLLQRYSPSSPRKLPNDRPPAIRRILIVDLDVHQGNGNAALFDGNCNVQTFSMHCSANYFSKKEHSDLDVELPIRCGDETYLSTLRHWLKRMEQHRFDESQRVDEENAQIGKRKQFDLIFFQSGVDIHHEDRLGRLSVTAAGISRRNALVFDFAHRMGSPLVICMGGGYPKGEDWTPIIEAHTNVYWEAHQYLSNKQ